MNAPTNPPADGPDQIAPQFQDQSQQQTGSAQGAGELGNDVLDIIAEVEGRLEKLRKVSRDNDVAIESVRQRQDAIDQAEAAVAQKVDELAQREKEIEQWRGQIEADRNQTARLRQQIEQQGQEIDTKRVEIERAVQASEQERTEIAQARKQLEDDLAQFARDHQEAETALQQQLTSLHTEYAQQLNEIRAQHERVGGELEQSQRELLEAREKLSQSLPPDEMEKVYDRIEELQTNYEQASLRADSLQADADGAAAREGALRSRLQEIEHEGKAREEQLRTAKQKLMQLAREFEAQGERIAAGTKALEVLEERDAAIRQLQRDLEQARAQARQAQGSAADQSTDLAERESWIAELESTVESLKGQLAEREAASQQAGEESHVSNEEIAQRDKAITELSSHIKSLQQALSQTGAELKQRTAEGQAVRESLEKELAQARREHRKAQGKASTDEAFMIRRRKRIINMRRAIRDRSRRLNKARDVLRQQAKAIKDADEERKTLQSVKVELEKAEKRMIRRWACSGSLTQVFILLLTLSLLGAASYAGVMKFWPTPYLAHSSIHAVPRPGFPLTDDQLKAWQTVHEDMARNDDLMKEVAQRLGQRGYTDLADPTTLKTFMDTNLIVSSTSAGMLEFGLKADGADDAQRILDTYTTALLSKSNAERGRRTDGATSGPLDPVKVDAQAMKDDRMTITGYVFGGAVLLFFLIGLPVYVRFRKAQSVFTENDELFAPLMDDQRWDQIIHSADGVAQHVIE